MRPHFLELLSHILSYLLECVEVRWGYGGRTAGLPELGVELLIAKRHHTAIGVIDDHKLLRSQQIMGNEE